MKRINGERNIIAGGIEMNENIEVEIKIKPLSINKAFQGRRFKTTECKKYEEEFLILLPEKEKIEGKLGIVLTFFLHHPLMSDIDNYLKLILDLLKKRGYIRDDRYFFSEQLSKKKIQKDEPERVKITIFKFIEDNSNE